MEGNTRCSPRLVEQKKNDGDAKAKHKRKRLMLGEDQTDCYPDSDAVVG